MKLIPGKNYKVKKDRKTVKLYREDDGTYIQDYEPSFVLSKYDTEIFTYRKQFECESFGFIKKLHLFSFSVTSNKLGGGATVVHEDWLLDDDPQLELFE